MASLPSCVLDACTRRVNKALFSSANALVRAGAVRKNKSERFKKSVKKGEEETRPKASTLRAQKQATQQGDDRIDVSDWKRNTEYAGFRERDSEPEFENSDVVRWFWEIVSDMSQEALRSLLMFTTGLRAPPVGGFAALCHMEDGCAFTIMQDSRKMEDGTEDGMPVPTVRAHVCYFRIYLPPRCENKEALHGMILQELKDVSRFSED